MRLVCMLVLFSICITQKIIGKQKEYNAFTKNEFVGLKNAKGKVVIPANYSNVGWSNSMTKPMADVIGFQKDGRWGLISVSNKIIVSPEYLHLLSSNSNKYITAAKVDSVTKKPLYGVFNTNGKIVIPFDFSVVVDIGSALIVAKESENESTYGLLNYKNEIMIPLKYRNIYPVSPKLLVLHDFNNKINFYHLDSQRVVLAGITKFELTNRGYIKVYAGMQFGLIDELGNILATINYKKIKWKNEQLLGLKYSHWVVYKGDNYITNEIDCDTILFLEDKAMIIGMENQLVADRNGIPITPEFETIEKVVGRQVVFKKDGKFGIYDGVKKEVIMNNIDSIRLDGEFYYTMTWKENRPVWAISDTFQTKRNKVDYEVIKSHHNRLFAVKRNGYWGFIARNGFEVIPCKYDSVGEFVVNDVVARIGAKEGILSLNGRWLVEPRLAKIELLNNFYFLSRQKNETALENVNGAIVYTTKNRIEFNHGMLWEYGSNDSIVKMDLRGQLIINSRNNLINSLYDEMKYESDNWIAVKKNNKFGFFDTVLGQLAIATRYEDVGRANNGLLISVKLLGKWGAINKNEVIVIQPNYDSIYQFQHGMAITVLLGKFGLISNQGDVLLHNRYDQLQRLDNGRFLTRDNGKYGLVDEHGKVIITNKYDSLNDTSNGFAIVRMGYKFGVVTLKGVNTIPLIYDNIIYNSVSDRYFAESKNTWEVLH